MSHNNSDTKDLMLKHVHQHSGQIDHDMEFDCESNCPFCNDQVICIQPQGVIIQPHPCFGDENILWINFKCLRCNQEFYEVWWSSVEEFSSQDTEYSLWTYYDYKDLYYDERHEYYFRSLKEELQAGKLPSIARYEYTVIEPPSEILREFSNSPDKFSYPIYRRSTPELYDLFADDD